MTSVNINQIQDKCLTNAAKAADSQGNNKYDGKLSADEASVFLRKATDADCDKLKSADLAEQVVGDEDYSKVKTEISLLKDIDKTEKMIKDKEVVLEEKKNQCDAKGPKPSILENKTFTSSVILGTMATGAAVGFAIGGPIGAIAGLSIGAIGPGIGMSVLLDKAEAKKNSYEYQAMQNEKDQCYEQEVKPLQAEIDKLDHRAHVTDAVGIALTRNSRPIEIEYKTVE